jgi:UDP-N-acetylenolpyruvoylglucosamine reductase
LLAANILGTRPAGRIYSNEEMKYGYRDSVLKREQGRERAGAWSSAELQLTPEPVDVLTARADGFTAHRKQTPARRGQQSAPCSKTRRIITPGI